jgi:hypothetical protein
MNLNLDNTTIFSFGEDSKPKRQGLSNFVAYIKDNGIATHNRYRVDIKIPVALRNKYMTYGETLSLLCESAELPSFKFHVKSTYITGAKINAPTEVQFGELFLFFLLEQNMKAKKFFDDWAASIINPHTGAVNFRDQYITQISIFQLDRNDMETYGIQLLEVFPNSTYPLQLSYHGSQAHRLPVSFTYRYWHKLEFDYSPENQDSLLGDILSSEVMGAINKVAPVVFGIISNDNTPSSF